MSIGKSMLFWLRRLEKPRSLLGFAIIAAIVQAVLLLMVPLVVRFLFIELVPERRIGPLVIAGLLLVSTFVIQTLIYLFARIRILDIAKKATSVIRTQLVEALYDSSQAYLDQSNRGTLHNTLVRDTERGDKMLNAVLSDVFPAFAKAVLLSIAIVWINPYLSFLLAVLVLPAVVLLSRVLSPYVKKEIRLFHQRFEEFDRRCYRILETLDLARTHVAESWETARARRKFDELNRATRQTVLVDRVYRSLQEAVVVGVGSLMLVAGGALISESGFTTGDLIAFFAAVAILKNSILSVVSSYRVVLEGTEATERIASQLSLETLLPYTGRREVASLSRIELDSVTFGYSDKDIFQQFSVMIDRGTTTALVGPNGCGKTTIINLILGFYRPRAGEIRTDGVSYDHLDMQSLRRKIGVLRQQPVLFDGTIRENICYAQSDAMEEDVIRASKLALADEFIRLLPNGYETRIGEAGSLLSGGQRQRIALARSLMGFPELLILDEPTNHLDFQSVLRLIDLLEQLPNSPGVLLITHDPTLIESCSSVVSLDRQLCSHVLTDGVHGHNGEVTRSRD